MTDMGAVPPRRERRERAQAPVVLGMSENKVGQRSGSPRRLICILCGKFSAPTQVSGAGFINRPRDTAKPPPSREYKSDDPYEYFYTRTQPTDFTRKRDADCEGWHRHYRDRVPVSRWGE